MDSNSKNQTQMIREIKKKKLLSHCTLQSFIWIFFVVVDYMRILLILHETITDIWEMFTTRTFFLKKKRIFIKLKKKSNNIWGGHAPTRWTYSLTFKAILAKSCATPLHVRIMSCTLISLTLYICFWIFQIIHKSSKLLLIFPKFWLTTFEKSLSIITGPLAAALATFIPKYIVLAFA